MANLIGQQLGQYEIIALLGKGGMSTVYRARQVSMNREVAVKVIRPDLAETEEFLARFRREAQIVASLSHPFILKVFDYGQQGELVYLAMELIRGGSLADVLAKGPLPLDTSVHVLEQVSSALDYAHRLSIIHRDLKPQNVLLDDQGNAFLTDFGVAKIMSEGGGALTRTGLAMGTPSYMAPEQWQALPIDARTDLYALGIMTYEMLSGMLPFRADTPFGMMHMHINERPTPLSKLRPELPAAIEQVINVAISKAVDQRYNSAGEFAKAFKAAATQTQTFPKVTKPVPDEDKTAEATSPVLQNLDPNTAKIPGKTPSKSVVSTPSQPTPAPRTSPAVTRRHEGREGQENSESTGSAMNQTPIPRQTGNQFRQGLAIGIAAAAILSLIVVGILAFVMSRNNGIPTPTTEANAGNITATTGNVNVPSATANNVAATTASPVVTEATTTGLTTTEANALATTAFIPPTLIPIATDTATSTLTLTPTETPTTETASAFQTNLTGWHQASKTGQWTETDNGLQGYTPGGDAFYLSTDTVANFTYEADMMITDGSSRSSAGLIFRSQADPLDGSYVVRMSTANGGQVNLFKFFGGKQNIKYLQLAIRSIPIQQNVSYHLIVQTSGTTITAYLDGNQLFQAVDKSFDSGYVGMDIFEATVVYQNVKVTPE